MKISELTVSALAKVITGDGDNSPYKPGAVLVKFFNEFGYNDVYGQGFPSRWTFVEDKLRSLNGKPILAKVIEIAVDKRNFIGTQFDVSAAVNYLNEYLKYDGYQLIDDGMFYRLRSLNDELVQREPSTKSSTTPDFPQKINSKSPRHLRAFLCHSSRDKPVVRELYRRLQTDRIDAWLDEEKLLPGQDWNLEIAKAVRSSDVTIVCLSRDSINKAGYVQKEIKYALEISSEQPPGNIFIIPLRLEVCDVPEQLGHWQWVDYFEEGGYTRLVSALKYRASTLDISIP